MRTVTAVSEPAAVVDEDTDNDGAKPCAQSTVSKLSVAAAEGAPLYGVTVAWAVEVPQADGELNTARAPPW
jgi:hypothetical protein